MLALKSNSWVGSGLCLSLKLSSKIRNGQMWVYLLAPKLSAAVSLSALSLSVTSGYREEISDCYAVRAEWQKTQMRRAAELSTDYLRVVTKDVMGQWT